VVLDIQQRLSGGLLSTFFALIVGVPDPPAPPPMVPTDDVFLLMVGALGPPVALSHPVLGPKLNVFLYECQDQVSHIKRQVVKQTI
jgi:hypothetical protein